ncbi:MAG: hypothetical protein IKO05_09190 [Selenomonadaceae bacterium]|nr:hypothetical protein [Selenomonadaceae bacterium]
MSQKGFATIFGLILILAVALCAKSIQESEMNYSYAAADYQMEFELQNAAISGIYIAAENLNDDSQPEPLSWTIEHADDKHRLKKIYVTVWGKRLDGDDRKIIRYKVTQYSPTKKYTEIDRKSGYILFSVAKSSNERMDGEIFRSAFAYVLSDEDDKKIYFMGPKEKDND